jgi:hypothetical protein
MQALYATHKILCQTIFVTAIIATFIEPPLENATVFEKIKYGKGFTLLTKHHARVE